MNRAVMSVVPLTFSLLMLPQGGHTLQGIPNKSNTKDFVLFTLYKHDKTEREMSQSRILSIREIQQSLIPKRHVAVPHCAHTDGFIDRFINLVRFVSYINIFICDRPGEESESVQLHHLD